MSNFLQSGNRWTMILLRLPQKDGSIFFQKVPFEIVRFNVDDNPSAQPQIVPDGPDLGVPGGINSGGTSVDRDKIYENIWYVDEIPWKPGAGGRVWFGKMI